MFQILINEFIEKNPKLKNAILYFAKEHPKRKGQPLYQTYLYKFLAFMDFTSIEEFGTPVFGLEYAALKEGPVPMDIYKNRSDIENDSFEFKQIDKNKYIVKSKTQADVDLSYFSEYEIEKMNNLLDKYSKRGVLVEIINRESHSLRAYKATVRDKLISYDDIFIDLKNKSEEDLTPEEESYLIYAGLKKITS